MNLSAAGLSQTEAKVYEALLSKKDCKPSELAKTVHETRTNMYKILDRLVELGLAYRFDKNKKLHYRPANPTRLIELARMRRAEQQSAELSLEADVQNLLGQFVRTQDQPGVRYFQGADEIMQMYEEQATTGLPIHYMLSPKAIGYFDFPTMHELRMKAVRAKVPRSAIVVDSKIATRNYKETDAQYYLSRTWLQHNDYTAGLEWGVYGNKVYMVTFDNDAFGMIIESQSMADGFLQLFKLIEKLQRATPDYQSLPKLAQYNQPITNQAD